MTWTYPIKSFGNHYLKLANYVTPLNIAFKWTKIISVAY